MFTALLTAHILAGSTSLVSGYTALYSRKGGTLHRGAGLVFACAMLTMAACGLTLAVVWDRGASINVPAALLTVYLVTTSLTTVRPLASATNAQCLHIVGLLVAIGIVATMVLFGAESIANGGKRQGIPTFPFVLFAVIAALGVIGDARLLRIGTALRGTARLTRHLWRMTFALFIAAMSFFFGQAKVIPQPLRIPALLALPILAVLVTLLYWLWRVRAGAVLSRNQAASLSKLKSFSSYSMEMKR
jgi:uncharacterized membrane protein